ncbi:MAG: tetratricopeptide repeat protein, partial [Acidimicrobiia bacterium]|nr:tetratricopeptide repeat protein [Acidimicrobiia bacterium]
AEERPQPEQVAYHADLADLWTEAVTWHTRAARSAEEVDALGVAAEHYSQADKAAQRAGISEVDRFEDLLGQERALDVLGRRDEQEILLKRLIGLELSLDEQVDLVERQAWLLGHTDRHDQAARLASEWADRAFEAGLPNHRLLTVLGVVRYWNGSFYEAIDALRLALKAAPDDQADVLIKNHLGRALIDVSEFDEGNALVAEALETAEKIGDVRGQVEAIIHQSISALRRGHNEEALVRAESSLPLSRSIGYRYGEGVSLVNLATLRAIRGQAGLALKLFDEAADVFDVLGSTRAKAIVRTNLAEIYAGFLGEYHEAAKLYSEAAAIFRSLGDERRELRSMSRLSGIDWESGRRRLARRRLQWIIGRAGKLSDPYVELEARRVVAECLSRNGDHDEAIPHLDRALELIDENALAYAVPSLLALRGEVAAAVGNLDAAVTFADRAAAANKPESEFGFVTAWRAGCIYRAVERNEDAAEQFALAFQLLESNLDGVDEPRAVNARSLPRFATIIEDYERFHRRVVEARLPVESAPTGRPLKGDEFRVVSWSASDPTDWDIGDAAQRRQRRVLRLCREAVEQGALARVHDLADLLGVSDRTVKRDLAELRVAGESPTTRRST